MGTVNFQVESGTRRSHVIKWLNSLFRDLDMPLDASEEELRAQLVDGALLCGILDVLYPSFTESPRGAYDSPRQRLTNIERFCSALELMGLPSFSITELEQGPLSTVVECLLSLRDHSNSNNTEDNSPDSARSPSQLRKRWKLPDDDELTSIEVAEGNHVQGGQDSGWCGEERMRSFLETELQDALKNPVVSGSSVASLHHARHKLHEVLDSKNGQYSEVSAGKILEMMKSHSLNNAPTQSLLSIMNGILDESIQRKSGEIPQRVAMLLRRVMQEIERRISTQAAHIRNQNNLMKTRGEKYQSIINVLEMIANGTNEEMKMLMNQLQLIKTEKLKIEEMKRLGEQDLIRLMEEKDNMEGVISELRHELEITKEFYEHRCQELQCKSMETKSQLDAKTKEVELVLYDSKRKIQELEETTELKHQSWIKKENILQNYINFQLQSLQGLRNASRSIEFEVMDSQKKWIEETNRLGLRLKVLTDAAENYHLVLAENQKLYNEVQDLKGNIRVYCRIRPFLPGQNEKSTTIDYIGENGELFLVNPSKQGKDGHRMFKFNKVFTPTASQAAVFGDVQPLIRSILDGYNVCIFAYGQTGSGKTYTMSGPNSSSMEDWGVNYRALHDLFDISQSRRNVYSYEIGVQMVEIYNEQVRDLLADEGPQKKLGIWSITQPNGLTVPEASVHPVMSTSDVLRLMQIGQSNRAVGSTALNERSSRSHSVLTVHVRGMDVKTGSTSRGCLHLIDLAGSERVDRSEATGDRLKEAQHINKSLSALGDVIFALAQKNTHVPYRNSKLTQVLQSSLGGQAKTLMFVQINPDLESYSETISTLKFAERVSGVELGAARSNREGRDIKELLEQVTCLKEVMAKKDEEIEQLRMLKDNRVKCSVSSGDLRTDETLANSSLSSGKEFKTIDKTYSVPDSYYELREKHFEINVGDRDLSSQADPELTGRGYTDFEERSSDISDDGLSQRNRSDSLSTTATEFSQLPGVGKLMDATAEKLSKAPSRVYGSLSAKNGQAPSSRLKAKDPLKSTSTLPSTRRSTISRPIGSSLKTPKPRQ